MKKLILFITGFVLATCTVHASHTTLATSNTTFDAYTNKSFIFTENGIDFSIYQDGQFDFYINRPSCGVNIAIQRPGVNISFNAGYDYDDYVQYDDYGAVVQIIDTPIFYDYYGRITQVGDVFINYNRYGYVAAIGGLYVRYNSRGHFLNCTGYVNRYNRNYRYQRNHGYFTVPAVNHCVVYTKPYRRYYTPNRYGYKTYRTTYYRNRYAKPYRGRTYYRPSDRIARYTRGRRVTTTHHNKSYHTTPRYTTTKYRKREGKRYTNSKQQYRKNAVATSRTRTLEPKRKYATAKKSKTKTRTPIVQRDTKRKTNHTVSKYRKTNAKSTRPHVKKDKARVANRSTRGRQHTKKYTPRKKNTSRSVVTTTRGRSR